MDIPTGNPNFNHLYNDNYQVETKDCLEVVALIEMVNYKRTNKETFLVTSLDKAKEQIEQVIEYFNATTRAGESPRKFIGFKDIKVYDSEYGIIDREGNYYTCEFGEHESLSCKIIENKGLESEFSEYEKETQGSRVDFLCIKKQYGLRHNPNPRYNASLRCEKPSEAMLKTEEDIDFYFRYIKKD